MFLLLLAASLPPVRQTTAFSRKEENRRINILALAMHMYAILTRYLLSFYNRKCSSDVAPSETTARPSLRSNIFSFSAEFPYFVNFPVDDSYIRRLPDTEIRVYTPQAARVIQLDPQTTSDLPPSKKIQNREGMVLNWKVKSTLADSIVTGPMETSL